MSKVITFSRTYPSYHPRKSEPTYFVEKIWTDLKITVSYKLICDLNPNVSIDILWSFWQSVKQDYFNYKGHTIRAGHRFKVGDWVSPRVWSGKPYNSKQIIIAPDIQIKKTWDVDADEDGCFWVISDHDDESENVLDTIAKNDGLTREDFMNWFDKPFTGQIICWNENIEY